MALLDKPQQGYWQGNRFVFPRFDAPTAPQYTRPQVSTPQPAPPSVYATAPPYGGGGDGGGRAYQSPTNAANYIGADGLPYSGGAYSVPYSSQQAGRGISGLLNQPSQTSAYGVTEIPRWANLLAGFFPGGTAAMAGLRGVNLSNIQDVQKSLGLDESSMLNVLNPFSDVARGASDASLGRDTFGQTTADVTFGGLLNKAYDKGGVKADFTTSLTPSEAMRRKAYSGLLAAGKMFKPQPVTAPLPPMVAAHPIAAPTQPSPITVEDILSLPTGGAITAPGALLGGYNPVAPASVGRATYTPQYNRHGFDIGGGSGVSNDGIDRGPKGTWGISGGAGR